MSTDIRRLRNLGPKTEVMLAEVGVSNEAELRELGAVQAYQLLRVRFGFRVTLNALYAMEAALRDCDWRELDADVKRDLLRNVDGPASLD